MKQRSKRIRDKETPSPPGHTSKKANTKSSKMSPSPKSTTPNSADRTISTEKTPEKVTPPKSPSASATSPLQSPVANLSTKDGAGWSNDQDNRPKPIRHKFSDLKALECQVYTDSINHLSKVINDEVDHPPAPRSHEDMLRVITNIICARPGEMLLLLNTSLRKSLLEQLVFNKKALWEVETATRFFSEDNLTRFVKENTEIFATLIRESADITSSQDSELKNVLHANSLEIASNILRLAADLLKKKKSTMKTSWLSVTLYVPWSPKRTSLYSLRATSGT